MASHGTAVREPLSQIRGGGRQSHRTQEPYAQPPVAEPTAVLAVREPIATDAQIAKVRPEPSFNETTRLRMELARVKADLVESEHQTQELREQSRRDLQEMLWQLKDSEQQLLNLHAKQASFREQHGDTRPVEDHLTLMALEHLQRLLTFLHPERLQEDAIQFCLGEDTEPLPAVPSGERRASGYVQQSLQWSSAVVTEARQLYFQLFWDLRRVACTQLLRSLDRLTSRQWAQHAFKALRQGATFKISQTPERSRVTGDTMTPTPVAMEDSWQSWRSWQRSALASRNASQPGAGAALCRIFMHWHCHCSQRRRAVRFLAQSLHHCQDRTLRSSLHIFRFSLSQRCRAQVAEEAERSSRRVTRYRRYWSAHLLMRVERGSLRETFGAWAQLLRREWKVQVEALTQRLRSVESAKTTRKVSSITLLWQRLRELRWLLSRQVFLAWRHRTSFFTAVQDRAAPGAMAQAALREIFQRWRLRVQRLAAYSLMDRWKCQDRWRMRRTWSRWLDVTLAARRRGILEKQQVKRLAKSILAQWSSWIIFMRRQSRWHSTFVKQLRGARSSRAVILLQAALASWQHYTLRKSFGVRHSQLKSQLRKTERLHLLQRSLHAWTLHCKTAFLQRRNKSEMARNRSASGAYVFNLFGCQLLCCLLRHWRSTCRREKALRQRFNGQRFAERGQILRMAFLQLHLAVARARPQKMVAQMLLRAATRHQHLQCREAIQRWRPRRCRVRSSRLVFLATSDRSAVVLDPYFYAWYWRSRVLRRPTLGRLAEVRCAQVTIGLRSAYTSWRQRCRMLRMRRTWERRPGSDNRRLMLRVWRKMVQDKGSSRAISLRTWFQRWVGEVAHGQQLRQSRWLSAMCCSGVRRRAAVQAMLVFWWQLASEGRQAAVNVALIASSQQWLVAAVAASNRCCMAGAWSSWLHRVRRARQALKMRSVLASTLRPARASDLRWAFRAWTRAAQRFSPGQRGARPHRSLELLGESLASRHRCQLVLYAWESFRWNTMEAKCQRWEKQHGEVLQELHQLRAQSFASEGVLKQRLRSTVCFVQRREQQFMWKCASVALAAWHQAVVLQRTIARTAVLTATRGLRPVEQLSRCFRAWKGQVRSHRQSSARLAALARPRSEDRFATRSVLLHWSSAVRRAQHRKERQSWVLREVRSRNLSSLHRRLLQWRAVVAEVKKHLAFLQKSVVLTAGACDPHDRRQLAVCWAFWRLYLRQSSQAARLPCRDAGRAFRVVQRCCHAWAWRARQASLQRRESRHRECKQELWRAKAKGRCLRQSFSRWQLHLQTSKLLLKADSAVALKASLGLLIVLRFCWTSWALLCNHRCTLAEQGQLRKLQGARHLFSTLCRALTSRLRRFFAQHARLRRPSVQAHWRDAHCSRISRRAEHERLRAYCHAWHVFALQLSRRSHRCTGEAIEITERRRYLQLLLRAWRATKGRNVRRLRHRIVPAWRCCGAMGLKSLLQLWRLQVQKLKSNRRAQEQCVKVRASCLIWHVTQLCHWHLLRCFWAMRMEARSARAQRAAQARLSQVWSEQIRQERLAEESRRQRAARAAQHNFDQELQHLKARSFSDGKLQAMRRQLEPVAEPLGISRRRSETVPEPVAREPVAQRNGMHSKLAPKTCAARSVLVIDRADGRLLDLLQQRGAIEEALSLQTARYLAH